MLRYFAALLVFTSTSALAQNCKISGSVMDLKTGETLPGATIMIEGTNTATSADFDGNFSISGVAPGTYDLVITYISYVTKKVTGVNVKGQDPVTVNVQLEPSSSQELQEVEVVVKVNKENNAALVLQQKNAAAVSDGISAESIRKTPDRSTSDVLKRVSGASIQDNKFAIIRGLSDRYNSAFINGSPLPSSESDRKAFAFDIFPANMLDNLVILKTATPDMPAEFAGGIINVNTKSIPDNNFQALSVGSSLHTLTTFKEFKSYKGGKYDWLGFDDGSRAIPAGIPETKVYEKLLSDQKAQMAKQLTPSWEITARKAMPPLNLQYSAGRNFDIGEKRFGFIFAYTYQNNLVRNQNIRREFEESATGVVPRAELKDDIYTESILNSALLNMAFRFNENNQLSFKNMYSINSSDRVNVRRGIREMDNDPHQYERSTNRLFTQNLLYTGQLEGDHYVAAPKIRIKWVGGFSDVNRSIPNMRRMVYQKQALVEEGDGIPFTAVVQNNGTLPLSAGNMFWSDTREKIYSARYSASIPLDFSRVKNEFKVGGMQQLRERDFRARSLGFSRYRKTSQPSAPFESELLLLPEEEIFAPEHLGLQANGLGGFKLDEATKSHDSYRASSMLNAVFAMTDTRILEKLRVILGARMESYQQKFSYTEIGSNIDRTVDTTVTDILPSLNLVYSLNEKANLRLSFYRTLSRPEFRELAPFAFYNFETDNILSGSPTLQRALIDNVDLRYEIYPGAGQLLSVSGFYKKFENPIELFQRSGTSGAAELSYTNVPSAENFGAELEYRFKLNVLGGQDSNVFLSNSTLFTNLALIKSKVDVSRIQGANQRPLQGQSPYIINAGYTFNHPIGHWSASASYNIVGRRIYIVGNVQEPDIWENGRHVLDLQFTKTFREKLEFRLSVKDVLAQTLLFYQNVNSGEKYEEGLDNRWQETTFGRTVSLNISYRF